MSDNRTPPRPSGRAPEGRERPTASVFRSFVRTLEKLERARPAPRQGREAGR
jgi:hypothetical protein